MSTTTKEPLDTRQFTGLLWRTVLLLLARISPADSRLRLRAIEFERRLGTGDVELLSQDQAVEQLDALGHTQREWLQRLAPK